MSAPERMYVVHPIQRLEHNLARSCPCPPRAVDAAAAAAAAATAADAAVLPVVHAARVSGKAPPPRYLHRVAEAGDGWSYLHGGNLESGLSGDVWRFRAWEPKSRPSAGRSRRGAPAPAPALKLRWEHVWGGGDGDENGAEEADGNASDSSSGGSSGGGGGGESDDETESEGAGDGYGGGGAAAAAPYPGMGVAPPPNAADNEPGGPMAFGAALAAHQVLAPPGPPPGLGAAAGGAQANNGVLGHGLEDAAAVGTGGPRPRCAASWTAMPGTSRIYLFGGQGSENEFFDDLWCFHAGGRGECRWERLDHVREPRQTAGAAGAAGGGGGGGGEDGDEDDREGEGAAGPWSAPEGRWGHTMVEHRGSLYMFGGSSPGVAYARLWRLDTSVSPCVWSLLSPARDMTDAIESGKPQARGGHSATVVRDSLYIFGGNITLVCNEWNFLPFALLRRENDLWWCMCFF